MRISDWSSDVCSSDLTLCQIFEYVVKHRRQRLESFTVKDLIFYANKDDLRGDILVSIHLDKSTNDILSAARYRLAARAGRVVSNIEMHRPAFSRSEEHTSELPSLMLISYAFF